MSTDKPEETQVATQEKKPTSLKDMVQGREFQLALGDALPASGCSVERFAKVAVTALTRNPSLKECTKGSFAQCLIDLASLGIEADGRRAHLIPFKNRRTGTTTCTLILDYKGIVELVKRSGDAKDIMAHVVYENDEFDFMYGTGAFIKHKPALKDRGSPICAYSHVTLKDGSISFEVMSIDEINKIRDDSRGYKESDPDSIWNKWYGEMARKTVFKRHSKWLTLSPEVHDAITKDDEHMYKSVDERVKVARPVTGIDPSDIITDTAEEGQSAPIEAETVE